jgi:hypothetical protein
MATANRNSDSPSYMLLNCIAERMHVISSLKNTANRFRKSVRAFVTRACVKRNRAQAIRTSSPANAMSIRDPVPGRRSSRSIFLAVITKRAAALPTIAVSRIIKHNGNGRAHPGEKCTLVCRMVAKISDHLVRHDESAKWHDQY